jgi:N-acetylglutamate synthase/N-acetylornithine aminotransferase
MMFVCKVPAADIVRNGEGASQVMQVKLQISLGPTTKLNSWAIIIASPPVQVHCSQK